MRKHEPCPEEEMRKRVRVGTICATLRRIYRLSDDEEIRLLARIATTMAKKMDAKLTEYKRTWDRDFWDGRKAMSTSITLGTYARRIHRKAEQLNKPLPLRSYLVPLLPGRNHVRILDLGSGPFTTIGNIVRRKRITVIAADTLAREYSHMISRRGIKPFIPVEYQDMERLTYHDGFFDIVHCANALDHTEHPDLALKEMLRVCKDGGAIYLRHFVNEGERKRYTGLHRWNIEAIGEDCRIWNLKPGGNDIEEFMISDILPGTLTVTARKSRRRETVVSIYRKA